MVKIKPVFVFDKIQDPNTYDHIYVDLDDTLILWELHKKNLHLIDFLIESSQRRHKGIHLVTRSYSPEESLELYGISMRLFDSIDTVGDKPKSFFVSNDGIFIDDSDEELLEVREFRGIPCYKPDMTIFHRLDTVNDEILNIILQGYKREDDPTPGGEKAGELNLLETSYPKLIAWGKKQHGVDLGKMIPHLKQSLEKARELLEDADLERSEMPIVPSKYLPRFAMYCENNGVFTRTANIPVLDLIPTQNTLYLDKVFNKMMKSGGPDARLAEVQNPKTFLSITEDMHLIDGHHRWLTLLLLAPFSEKNCFIVDAPVSEAIELANGFTDAMQFERNHS